ncbi:MULTISPECIES: TQO small subunit DoxD [Bizionia]|uniref:DoxX family membrane protein n=1 Tax=Bizionia algoritergicola TaxID=291187 RepID=A0A5D0QWN7_9FLAO|nr:MULTISPECIES: TQO small subunit DoxD [Bizionia]OBX22224.1 quinol oxidase [Bizionia sp. APA-3]TYB73205.1 DoxX family membrane protein [Bizionia algoritergicola]
MKQFSNQSYNTAGLFTLAIRLVVGWTYFSAFWRRVALANKLNPDEAGYIGEKFNHFLPNALGIKPIIEYLVLNPDALWWAMVIFTIIEGIVGLLIILGLFTRLMSIGVFFLAMGILLGSGWIGTTCLDEWQIGVLGIATGFTLFLSGSGHYSLDKLLMDKNYVFTRTKWFGFLGSGILPIKNLKPIVLFGALAIFSLTLFTNQYFHGGVFGTLHNKSIKPKLELSQATISNNTLEFQVYRVEGVDVYGSFLIGMELMDSNGKTIMSLNGTDLSRFPTDQISNHYVAKIKPGVHSLIIPLGAKADISISLNDTDYNPNSSHILKLTDISGLTWEINVN